MELIIYHSYFSQYGGCETAVFNIVSRLRNYYDITVLHGGGEHNQLNRLSKLCKVEQYDSNKIYKCDIMIRNSAWGIYPDAIISKSGEYIQMIHSDYAEHKRKGTFKYIPWSKTTKHIACGEYVAEKFKEATGFDCIAIRNMLDYTKPTNQIIKLITCSRLDPMKGWGRMQKMIEMMRDNNIKFQWLIFTDSPKESKYEEVIFMKPRFDIWDYLANADYTVLLSDIEGLPFTVLESLQYKTACIVTDIGGCTELIKHGVNGYVVPLNMNFDINIIRDVPILDEFNGTTPEDWISVLGDAEYVDKPFNETFEKVATVMFPCYYSQEGRDCAIGDKLVITSEERYLDLLNRRYIR